MTLQPPCRLRLDTSVEPSLRRELARAPRSAEMPIGYDLSAGLARFEASLGSAATGGSSARGSGAAEQAAVGSEFGSKTALVTGLKTALVTGLAVGLLAVGGATLTSRSVSKARSSSHPSTTSLPRLSPLQIAAVEPSARGLPSELEESSARRERPNPRASAARTAPLRSTQHPALSTTNGAAHQESTAAAERGPAPVSTPATGLAQEMEQLARVRSLEITHPEEALRLAEQGDSLFPGGLFRQERQAIAIQSLVRLHRVGEARQRARAFKQAYPRSPFAERMKQLTDEAGD